MISMDEIKERVILVAVTGDADAVKNAVLTARDVGLQLLVSMGSYPESPATPYLQ